MRHTSQPDDLRSTDLKDPVAHEKPAKAARPSNRARRGTSPVERRSQAIRKQKRVAASDSLGSFYAAADLGACWQR